MTTKMDEDLIRERLGYEDILKTSNPLFSQTLMCVVSIIYIIWKKLYEYIKL